MTARASERLFFVEGPLTALRRLPMSRVKLGCLSHDRTREVWVRQEGRQCGIGVVTNPANGNLLQPDPIPQSTFDTLWKNTESHQVEVTRHQLPHGDANIEIDVFHGTHTPLITARVRFATAASARRFRKPAFLGSEILRPDSLSLRQIALHGIPSSSEANVQAGAVPFLFKKGILHIVLITSSSGARWLIPKGHLESGMSLEEVALMEAAEEAGAIGTIEPGCRMLCPTEDGRTLQLFPLRVATLLPHWPERFVRRRVVLPVYRALLRISDPALARALRDLSRRLKS
jgi:8-oxo-dGTP pyrophosphatase MutT (NUDIX family)/CYTH domain-containing protein